MTTRATKRILTPLLALFALLVSAMAPPAAVAADNPSGLPLPRFASLRSKPINVRVGPGTKYVLAWTFNLAGLPVEITQEFDTWRKIRDFEGAEGWVHQNLLSGRRTVLIAPWAGDEPTALRAKPETGATVRAWLGSSLLANVETCDADWCRLRLVGPDARNYTGFARQTALWGVYADEVID